jgi:hypothetical protein
MIPAQGVSFAAAMPAGLGVPRLVPRGDPADGPMENRATGADAARPAAAHFGVRGACLGPRAGGGGPGWPAQRRRRASVWARSAAISRAAARV